MDRRRWWQAGEYSVEGEERAFADAGLAFELDRELFEQEEVVVFGGDLRLDDQRVGAEVRYPPSYGDGEPVVVIAAALPIGRHRTLEGSLCLDHPVLGEVRPMGGAEAVQRAEHLWWLWENDRDALRAEEADAPDPRANYYIHDPATAVAITDADVTGFREGELRVNVVSLRPFVLSVYERTRELGTLRAVGMTRRQARRMVRHESVITGLIGAALGLPLGAFLAALVTGALSQFEVVFSLPLGQLVAFAVVALGAGILAAVMPARRAARLNVLQALQYE